MTSADLLWKQRFGNFKEALVQLNEADELSQQRPLSRLENQGLIQVFEFTFELAWNALKDFLTSKGAQGLFGSKLAHVQPSNGGRNCRAYPCSLCDPVPPVIRDIRSPLVG